MKTRALLLCAIAAAVTISGCATTNEPQPHVEQCHVQDGMLLDRSDCVADHNQIVASRREKATQRNLSRSIDRAGLRR